MNNILHTIFWQFQEPEIANLGHFMNQEISEIFGRSYINYIILWIIVDSCGWGIKVVFFLLN